MDTWKIAIFRLGYAYEIVPGIPVEIRWKARGPAFNDQVARRFR
jgi:hypothetical protein